MTVGFPLGGHRKLCDESDAELFRRFTARRQSIPVSPLDENIEDKRNASQTRGDKERIGGHAHGWL